VALSPVVSQQGTPPPGGVNKSNSLSAMDQAMAATLAAISAPAAAGKSL